MIDTGVYIGRWYNKNGDKEYRVTHTPSIEDTDDPFNGDLFQVLLFGKSEVYTCPITAMSQACELAEALESVRGTLSKGIVEKFYDTMFPRYTHDQAVAKLKEFYDNEEVDLTI